MKKYLLSVIFFLLFSCVNAEESTSAKGAHLQGMTFSVALEDLHLDQEDILVNVDGNIYKVHTLQKQGNRWVAELSPYGNCPWGHPLCRECGQCHLTICPVRQPRTYRCR